MLYSQTCVKRPLSKTPQIGFQDQPSLHEGQKYCIMLQGEHSAILSTFIKLPFDIESFVYSIFEWPFYTGFTVHYNAYMTSCVTFKVPISIATLNCKKLIENSSFCHKYGKYFILWSEKCLFHLWLHQSWNIYFSHFTWCNGWHINSNNLNILVCVSVYPGFLQASMSKIQGLLKASPTVFKDLKLMKM